MKVESVRLTKLVQEIVDLSRLQVADTLHEPVLVDVARAATDAVDQSRLVAEARSIELAVSLTGDAKVFGDPELLTTAIRNLVGNAVNYSGDGTKVAVGVRCEDGLVEVDVSDQGQGIPKAEQGRIFERFYRVDAARSRATGGTGLGLAIVKHICANHGGEVTVWSEEGRGSTFTMRLPAAPSSGAPSHLPAAAAAPPAPPRGPVDVREVTR
jgi:two-component system sensor histidine kinase SenX3